MKVYVIVCTSSAHVDAEMRSTDAMLETLGVPYKISPARRCVETDAGRVMFVRADESPERFLGLHVTGFENRTGTLIPQELRATLRAAVRRG